jgi:hypothetical protein
MAEGNRPNGNRPLTEAYCRNFDTRNCTIEAVKTANVIGRDRGNVNVLEILELDNLTVLTNEDMGYAEPKLDGFNKKILEPGKFLKKALFLHIFQSCFK